jgi:hypothetical protein
LQDWHPQQHDRRVINPRKEHSYEGFGVESFQNSIRNISSMMANDVHHSKDVLWNDAYIGKWLCSTPRTVENEVILSLYIFGS